MAYSLWLTALFILQSSVRLFKDDPYTRQKTVAVLDRKL